MTDEPLRTGTIRPPRQFLQLGILVADGSGSMTDMAAGRISKAQATNHAIREMFTRFKVARVANNFQFGLISFDERPVVRMLPCDLANVDDNADYDPLNGHGGGTNLFLALEEAERMAKTFLGGAPAGGVYHSVVILVMSDGCCSDPVRTRAVADRIRHGAEGERIKICSTLFATVGAPDPGGEQLLRDIASDPITGYKTVYDGNTLRAFFEASMSAASGGVRVA